ncbi:MAG: tyrosine--tRNA ligase [Alphaproteobacteria bacterium]|nr:tyrosine--tRNA ligase [Alphaproteobacteria bacterium]OJV46965.1 MAG: tyrosine--tRNA ligase [Alphaproteobacteria bacterium 43-37]
MAQFKSEFLHTLHGRGFIHQGTDLEGLDDLMRRTPIAAYIGFDATATSLHAGSLIQIMMLTHLQRCGHKPIVLMGGGTTKVGDPTGKDTARQLLTDDDIATNIAGIQSIFNKFITFGHKPSDAILLNNADWLDHLNYMNFLRDYGRFFSVNRMLTFDSVKLRLEREQPLSFLEFNYMILQAFDFAYLAQNFECRLQMGGSDQWGNVVNGIDLGRRLGLPQLYGLSSPLLETSSGMKMGKTASGAIWLNPDKLSAFDYWQFWRNTSDADVARFLKLYTFLPLEEIEKLGALQGAEINDAKKVLADEATKWIHSEAALDQIHRDASSLFTKGTANALGAVETIVLTEQDFLQGEIPLIHLLQKLSLTSSNSDGRRLIRSRAVRIDDTLIEDEMFKVHKDMLLREKTLVISSGKKNFKGVKLSDN